MADIAHDASGPSLKPGDVAPQLRVHGMYLSALDAIKGAWTRKQYNTVLFCLHPDQRDNQPAERRDLAFRLVAHEPWASLLVKKTERVMPPGPKPPTIEEMAAMKRQAKAVRKAERELRRARKASATKPKRLPGS